jgi:hypothetical protein
MYCGRGPISCSAPKRQQAALLDGLLSLYRSSADRSEPPTGKQAAGATARMLKASNGFLHSTPRPAAQTRQNGGAGMQRTGRFDKERIARGMQAQFRRDNAEQAALQANPAPRAADFDRALKARASTARAFSRLGCRPSAKRAWEDVRALRLMAQQARNPLSLSARQRLTLRALQALQRRPPTRARQQRSRRSRVRLARPSGAKKKSRHRRGSGDDDHAGIAGGVTTTDGAGHRQGGVP